MVKKVAITAGLLVLVLTVSVWGIKHLLFDSGKNEEKVLENALVLGDVVIDMYREEITPSTDLDVFKNKKAYSEDVEKAINEQQDTLKRLDEAVFDLSKYYYENFEVYEEVKTDIDEYLEENPDDKLFEVAGDEETGVTEEADVSDYTGIEDSSIIYYEGDKALINVKDFTFSEGVATITFEGRTFDILQVNVPQTYTAIKQDTKYLYSYTNHMFSEDTSDFVDLKYTSVKDPTEIKIIRVYFDKKDIITGFVVR